MTNANIGRLLKWPWIVVGAVIVAGGLALIGSGLGWLPQWSGESHTAVIVAGATLMLVAFGMFAWIANVDLAASTRQLAQLGEDDRKLRRASLDVVFDRANVVLWWTDKSYVRVMVTNSGPAMAKNVIVTLEKIEPAAENPMLRKAIGQRGGINVLPSRLEWKGHLQNRLGIPRCDINPQSREYFDVLVYRLGEHDVEVMFHIVEKDAFLMHYDLPPATGNVAFPLVWEREYDLYIRATAANADPADRVFRLKATRGDPPVTFSSV